MKKIISIILLCAVLCTLSGCNQINGVADDIIWDLKAPDIANEQAGIILDCLKTGDSEKLEALFCKNVSSSHDLKTEIAEAIEFIDGNIIDDGKWSGMASGGKSIDNGKTTKLNIHPSIWDIKTDTGKEYDITFTSYLIYEKDSNYVGMTHVHVWSENNDILIGEVIY